MKSRSLASCRNQQADRNPLDCPPPGRRNREVDHQRYDERHALLLIGPVGSCRLKSLRNRAWRAVRIHGFLLGRESRRPHC